MAITREGVQKIGRTLAVQRGQRKVFDVILNQLLAVLGESQRSSRAKAMRSLTTLVEADADILADVRPILACSSENLINA